MCIREHTWSEATMSTDLVGGVLLTKPLKVWVGYCNDVRGARKRDSDLRVK